MSWELVERRIAAAVASLPEQGTVVVEATDVRRETLVRRRRLGGLVPERREPTTAYVQAVRTDDLVQAECVGGPDVGGGFPVTPAEHAALLALGWRPPTDRRAYPNYASEWMPVSGGAPACLADLAVRSLRDVLGCRTPAAVEVRLNQ